MSSLILVALFAGAAGVALYFGLKHGRLKVLYKDAQGLINAQHRLLSALQGVSLEQEKKHELLKRIDSANNANDINRLYSEILRIPKD